MSPSRTQRLPQTDDKIHCRYTGRDGVFTAVTPMVFTITWSDGKIEQIELGQVTHLTHSGGSWII